MTGYYLATPFHLNYAGFIRQADGTIITGLRDPDALHTTYPFGINARGWLVGAYYLADDNFASAFLYVGGNKYINYNYPGATETVFTGTNDRGRICGYYRDSAGNAHGMILQVVQ